MIKKEKPRIGFLGIMHGLYDKSQPEIPANQEVFAREVIKQLEDVADIYFPGVAKDRGLIEEYVKEFNEKEFDGIMIVNLLYSPGMRIVQALQKNTLPLLIANIQPLPSVTKDWNWSLLTTNQGIHGVQDTANMIMRMGTQNHHIITEDWQSDNFKQYFSDWALAANTAARLRRMKAAIFGRMHNMGDILGDDAAFYRVFGLEVNQVTIGPVLRNMEAATEAEIDALIEEDKKNFEIDPSLPEESHRYAAKMQYGFEKYLIDNGYEGFSQFFDIYKEDGRLSQLPILGASNLMAKGYGYSAEGDTHVMALTMIGHMLCGNPHFTEMYSLDFARDAALMSHMGEGNWKLARKDRPVKLIDRPLDIGDVDNPPTPVFSIEPGEATLVSLVAVEGEYYRMVVSKGEILDNDVIPNIPMNYSFFKPEDGIREAMDNWLEFGGTHHEVLFLGDHVRKLEMFCDILGIEFCEV